MTTLNPIIEQSDIESITPQETVRDQEIKCCSIENIKINCLAVFCVSTICFIFFLFLGGFIILIPDNYNSINDS